MKIFFFDWSDNIRESNRRKKIKESEESFISKYSRRKNEKSTAIMKKESVYQITSSNESEKLISEESNFKSNSNSNSLNNNSVSNTAIDINNNNTNINNNNENNNNDNLNYDLNVIKETNEFIKDSENAEENLRRFLNIVNEPYDYNENFIRSKKDKEKDELRKKLKEKNNNENNNEEDKKEE